jgi:hypothetical protein
LVVLISATRQKKEHARSYFTARQCFNNVLLNGRNRGKIRRDKSGGLNKYLGRNIRLIRDIRVTPSARNTPAQAVLACGPSHHIPIAASFSAGHRA